MRLPRGLPVVAGRFFLFHHRLNGTFQSPADVCGNRNPVDPPAHGDRTARGSRIPRNRAAMPYGYTLPALSALLMERYGQGSRIRADGRYGSPAAGAIFNKGQLCRDAGGIAIR